MEIVLFAVVSTILAAGAVARSMVRTRRWRAALAVAARTFGVREEPGTWTRDPVVRGLVAGAHHLTIESYTVGTGSFRSSHTRIRCTGGQPEGLQISSQGFLRTAMGRALGVSDLEIGDPRLDGTAVFRGEPERRLRGRMDAGTRAAIARAVALGAELDDRRWILSLDTLVTDPEELVAAVRAVLDAARALAAAEPPDALTAIATTDPLPGVRRRALASLLDRDGPGPWVVPFTTDPDGLVAVLAAGALGSRGRSVLVGLLDHRSAEVRRGAGLALAALARGPDGERVERVLIGALGEGDVVVIDALGRFGTAAAVPALAALAEGRARIRARSAIREIQGRMVGAERGTLALADGGGSLAVVDRKDG